jgi:hypothetical protein
MWTAEDRVTCVAKASQLPVCKNMSYEASHETAGQSLHFETFIVIPVDVYDFESQRVKNS